MRSRPARAAAAALLLLLLLAVSRSEQKHSEEPTGEAEKQDSPPRLVHQPASVQALAYEPQTFECPVESEPEAEFKWFKDDQLLPSSSANLDQTGAELTFRQLDEADAGDYHCQATNYLGSVTSDRFQVTVKSTLPDPLVRLEPRIALLQPGEQLQLTCTIPPADANRGVQVFWRRNGRRLANVHWLQPTEAAAPPEEPEGAARYVASQLSASQFALRLPRASPADNQTSFTCAHERPQAAAGSGRRELARESPPATLLVTPSTAPQGPKPVELPDSRLAPPIDNLADWTARLRELAGQQNRPTGTTQLEPPPRPPLGPLEWAQHHLAAGRPLALLLAALLLLSLFALLQLSLARRRNRLNSYMKHQYAGSAGSAGSNSLAGNPFEGDPVLSSLMSRTLAGSAGALGGAKKYRTYRDQLRKVAAVAGHPGAPEQPLSASDLVDGYLAAVAAASQQRGAELEPYLFGSAHLPSLYGQSLAAREQARTLLQAGDHMRSLSNLSHLKQQQQQQQHPHQSHQQQPHQAHNSRPNHNGSHLNLPMSFSFAAPQQGRPAELQAAQLLAGEHYPLVNCSSVSPSSSSSLVCGTNGSSSAHRQQQQQSANQNSLNHYSTIEPTEDDDHRYEQLDGPPAPALRPSGQLRRSLAPNSAAAADSSRRRTSGRQQRHQPSQSQNQNQTQSQNPEQSQLDEQNQKRHNFQDQLSPYAVSSICAPNLGSNQQRQQQPPPPINSEAMRALNEQFDINQLMLLEESGAGQPAPTPFAVPPPPPPPAQPPVAAGPSVDD